MFFNLGASSNQPLSGPTLIGSVEFSAPAGHSAFVPLNIVNVTGTKPGLRETRRFIEIRPNLDFQSLMPGERATQAIRDAAAKLKLDPQHGVRVRLTGTVPMADDEYGSLTHRARLMATLMMVSSLCFLITTPIGCIDAARRGGKSPRKYTDMV